MRKMSNGFHFGLEQEFFYVSNFSDSEAGQEVYEVPPEGCPRDNAGWLVEARGRPFRDPIDAVFSLKADIDRIERKFCNKRMEGMSLVRDRYLWASDRQKVPMRVKNTCLRKYGLPKKDKLIENLYGEALTDEQLEWDYAGIHINISKMHNHARDCETMTEMFDYVPIIRFLDERFKDQIKNAHRLRGSYSIKELEGGPGLEYRSLPTTVDLDDIAIALLGMKKELNL